MKRLEELTDRELEVQFLEAEQHALAWAELGVGQADQRGSRWMKIAGELQAELERRALTIKPRRSRARPR